MTTGERGTSKLVGVLGFENLFDGLVGHLFFKADNRSVGTELTRDILDQFAVERLVDGDEDSAHQQRCDQVLATNIQLLRKFLYADAFGNGNGASDRHRLLRGISAHAWRRNKALHRAFFALLVALVAPPGRRLGPVGLCGRGASPGGGIIAATRGSSRDEAEARTCDQSRDERPFRGVHLEAHL